jgi:hypothetical protein
MNNCLKLVYDNWKNDNPIPNGYVNNIGLTPTLFWIPYEVIDIIHKNNCKVQNIKLEEADENSYYIVNHQCSFEFIFGKKRWILSKEIENCIKEKNLKVIFLNEHESFDNIEIHLENLQRLILEKNLDEKNFFVLSNNSNLYDAKKKLKSNINIFKTNSLIELVTEFNTTDIKFIDKKKFIFLLHNRTPKPHRVGLLILLKYLNILDEIDVVDWSLVYPMVGNPFTNTLFMDKTFINIHSSELRPIYKEFLTTTKFSYFEENKNWFLDASRYLERKYNELNSFEQSYINIVTESYFSENDTHITEKTFRPFLCFQIPLFLASYKHVDKLKEEHPNLHLFEDLIDHSYDNERDDNKRLHLVTNEIKRLSKMRDYISDYYIKNEYKFKENLSYILNFSNNKTTLEFFKSLTI